jgi:hypothetical protein
MAEFAETTREEDRKHRPDETGDDRGMLLMFSSAFSLFLF